jgi:subtilisin family serine protease
LGTFSNWGATTVDLGAPGVAVYSTTVGNGYSDKVIDFPQFGLTVTWDGTSMAAPHVSGAAALYLSDHPKASVTELKSAVLKATKPIDTLSSKATTNGKLSVEKLP